MKLTKSQINSLAEDLAKQKFEELNKANDEIYNDPKLDALVEKQLQAYRALPKYLKALFKDEDRVKIELKQKAAKEKGWESYLGRYYDTRQDFITKINIATIDAKDLEDLYSKIK